MVFKIYRKSQCCGSRIMHPGFKNSNKRYGWKISCCHILFCCYEFHKIENYLIFYMLKKKILANFQRIKEVFAQKIVTKLSKIRVWDPGPGINLSRIQGSQRHRIPDPDPHHWKIYSLAYGLYSLWFPSPEYFVCNFVSVCLLWLSLALWTLSRFFYWVE